MKMKVYTSKKEIEEEQKRLAEKGKQTKIEKQYICQNRHGGAMHAYWLEEVNSKEQTIK